jgi:hypothetical protein
LECDYIEEILSRGSATMTRLLTVTITGLMLCSPCLAQTIGPGGIPIAPGPSQPRDFTPGGIGPGGVPVAPGPAARGVNIERIGPGGGRVAPGPAGSVDSGPSLNPSTTVAPSSGGIRGTIRSKRSKIRGKKPKVSGTR